MYPLCRISRYQHLLQLISCMWLVGVQVYNHLGKLFDGIYERGPVHVLQPSASPPRSACSHTLMSVNQNAAEPHTGPIYYLQNSLLASVGVKNS